jgi:four helix bundle protein
MTQLFDHERLEVYRQAIDFVALADVLIEALPRGRSALADQLHRAATSVVLNIAEGAGEFCGHEKARFYRMAKRSATECAAALDVLRVLNLADGARLDAGRQMLLRVVSMLVKLVRSVAGEDVKAVEPGTGRGTARCPVPRKG